MARKKKTSGSRQRLQGITLCISTTMVLILLGMVVVSVQTARNLSSYVRENLCVTIMLSDDSGDGDALALASVLEGRSYTKAVEYISKEQAQREQSEAMGSDPSEFLGFNPFTATLELRLRSAYANGDSLAWIVPELLRERFVTDVSYQEDLMDKVNSNLRKAGVVLLVLALLLTCVSFSLINNTVRLEVYSRRFLIHTMKLVGASWSFIRAPFVRNALGVGVTAAFLACCVLGGGVYLLYGYEPGIRAVISGKEMALTFCSVFLFGIVITIGCSYISVNKFLRMTAGEIYKS